MEREAQETAKLRRRIIQIVQWSDEAIFLENMSKDLGVSEESLRAIIEEEVEGGELVGQYTNDGRSFITDDVFRRYLKGTLNDEREDE